MSDDITLHATLIIGTRFKIETSSAHHLMLDTTGQSNPPQPAQWKHCWLHWLAVQA
ncbi:MAG: hypothetical protein H0V70_10705 [Ktedonobacteraceae bacterium]|nr:hypothetical protein [Ktedonobacteraceae bacterium]